MRPFYRRPMGKKMDDFNTLGVPANATPGTIKTAWRNLVRKNHPDLVGNSDSATQRLSEINAAYDRIVAGVPRRDPEAREPRGPKERTRPFTFDDFKTFWETKRPRQTDRSSATKAAADDFQTFDEEPKPEAARPSPPSGPTHSAPDEAHAQRRTPGPRPSAEASATQEPREPYVSASFEAGRRAARAAYARAQAAGAREDKPRKRPGLDLEI